MNDEKEKWTEEVFQSMKGSQRAMPPPELFAKIEGKIGHSSARIVPMSQWRYVAAAAALILLVNTTALIYYGQYEDVAYEGSAMVADTYSQSLITSYQIYE